MKLLYVIILIILLTSAAVIPAFEAGAYIPHYRLEFLPGAENSLGRPAYDTAAHAWDGRIVSDTLEKRLAEHWYEKSWSLRLSRGYDAFYLHIPFDESFLTGQTPDNRQISYLKTIISKSKTSVYLSLIGNTVDFMPVVTSDNKLDELVRRLEEISRNYELDGIDIDWEFPARPRQAEKQALMIIASALKKNLPEKTVLSIAVSRWRLPDEDLFDIVDEIHLMAYDGYGRHSTFESAVADAETILMRFDQPAKKLILGLPFYGRIYTPDSDEYWIGTKNYREIIRDYSPVPTEDEADGYFFNSPYTIARKTEWALMRGLGGVFVWEPFYDVDGVKSLTTTIRQA
ncbi:MAG: glycoside hydrolase family 18 protein, partial [Spirochaetaceae bacterium]|nr:glycoside hydrolase family 18 protein [Spirochaetaceae bacterium]